MNHAVANSGALATSAEGPEPRSEMQSHFSHGLSVPHNFTLLSEDSLVWWVICVSGYSAALWLLSGAAVLGLCVLYKVPSYWGLLCSKH